MKGLTGYAAMMLENPENLLILANRGSDNRQSEFAPTSVRVLPSLAFSQWVGVISIFPLCRQKNKCFPLCFPNSTGA
jgi:hypothetical protein